MAILCSGVQSRANSVVMILQFSLERKQKPLSLWHKNIYILLRALQNEDLNTANKMVYAMSFLHAISFVIRVLSVARILVSASW